ACQRLQRTRGRAVYGNCARAGGAVMTGVSVEVLLAAGYAVFLLLAAACLEAVARYSNRRAARYRVDGFRYDVRLDHWECPAGQRLYRFETDYKERLARYRAPAHHCNACAIKGDCTDSDQGREVERRFEGWLDKELRRFHSLASLTVLVLAM